MSDISFSTVPANQRAPLFFAELDNSQANTATVNQRGLVIAPMASSGTGVANTAILCQGTSHAKTVGGVGSVLALMVAAWRKADTAGELWMLPLSDDTQAVAASGSVTFAAPATDTGVVSLYIGGVVVWMSVTSSLTLAQLASAMAALINAASDLPVTAAVDAQTASKVNLTAKNKGLTGNEIDLQLNFGGTANSEATPPGMTITIVAMTGGLLNPSIVAGLANLLDKQFDFIALPFTDATSLDAMKAFLSSKTGRWAYDKMLYGGCWAWFRGTVGALTTFGNGRNDEHMSIMGINGSPTPAWVSAADYAATAAVALRADPARPLHGLALSSTLPPPLQDRFAMVDRNTLLFDGISTCTVGDDGTVAIEQAITTYQTNSYGQADNSYLKVNTLYTLAYGLRALQTTITSRYGRVKLADNGTRAAPGSSIVTPNTIKADLIAQYSQLVDAGYFQNLQEFQNLITVQRNSSDPNRVDVLWPAVPINQLDVLALLAQFRLT